MATTDYVLSTTRYLLPGVYVGQIYQNRPIGLVDIPRLPCWIGRGSLVKTAKQIPIRRGYVEDELLRFEATYNPPRAQFRFKCNGKKTDTVLKTDSGQTISEKYWDFEKDIDGDYRVITLASQIYDERETYRISYQGADQTIPDFLPYNGLISMTSVGATPATSNYKENLDFSIIYEMLEPIPDEENNGSGKLKLGSNASFKGKTTQYTVVVQAKNHVNLPMYGDGPVEDSNNTGSGVIKLGELNNYIGGVNRQYFFTIMNAQGNGTFDVDWYCTGNGAANGSFTVSSANYQNITIHDGVRVDFQGLAGFQNNDKYTLTITFELEPIITISWMSDDPKGGSRVGQDITMDNAKNFLLEKGMTVTFAEDKSQLDLYEEGDVFKIDAINTDSISWDYVRTATETIKANDIYYDHLGRICGTRLGFYLFLNHSDIIDIISVVEHDTGKALSFKWKEFTRYISLGTNRPQVDLDITFKFRNAPQLGSTYYVTYNYTRPETEFNTVRIVTRETFRDEIGYPSIENHLGIELDHAYEAFDGLATVAVVQVKDQDGDGVYNQSDYNKALEAAREDKEISDICILANMETNGSVSQEANVGNLYQVIIDRNDPFKSSETLAWIGLPEGTEVGYSVDNPQPGTHAMYFNDFQVYGDGVGHGCFIGIANTWAKRIITQEDGTSKQITLDGSYIAGMFMAMRAAFDNPWETELRKIIPGYTEIEQFNQAQKRYLGAMGYCWLAPSVAGSTVYRVEDCGTFDFNAPDYRYINAMAQKQYVCKYIRREMDRQVIGIVPNTRAEGVSIIRRTMLNLLRVLVSSKVIAPYDGDIGGDAVEVWNDYDPVNKVGDPTKYHMLFYFNLRYDIRRVTGLYSVDDKAWS